MGSSTWKIETFSDARGWSGRNWWAAWSGAAIAFVINHKYRLRNRHTSPATPDCGLIISSLFRRSNFPEEKLQQQKHSRKLKINIKAFRKRIRFTFQVLIFRRINKFSDRNEDVWLQVGRILVTRNKRSQIFKIFRSNNWSLQRGKYEQWEA